jgi:hypothetical protein
MTTAARPMPRPAPAAPVGGRPAPQRPAAKAPTHAAKTDAAHAHAHAHAHPAGPNYLLIAAALAVVIVAGAVAIWGGGSARNLPLFGGGGEVGEQRRDANTTMMYRDLKNGRLMVMEIGPNGTKMKGTIDKTTLPLANDEANKPQSTRQSPELTTFDRVQALGSAFR